MSVTQISVFVENTPGKLADLTQLLAGHQFDMLSICVADTTNYGIVRMIVSRADEAAEVITQNGYTLRKTEVLAVQIPDEPGALATVLRTLSDEKIVVEYLYSMVRGRNGQAVIVFRVDALEKAEALLTEKSYRLLTQADFA